MADHTTPAPITSGDTLKTYEMDQAIELLKNVAAIAINMLDVDGKPKTGDTLNMAVKGVEAAYLASRATDAPAQGEQMPVADKECRHCGWLCRPNPAEGKRLYPLAAPAAASADAAPAGAVAVWELEHDGWDAIDGVAEFLTTLPVGTRLYYIPAAAEVTPAPAVADAVAAMERAKKLPVWDNIDHALHVELGIIFKALGAPATTASSVRDGWKLVPLEPTHAMSEVAVQAEQDCYESYETIYRLMVAAAPTPPPAAAQSAEGGREA